MKYLTCFLEVFLALAWAITVGSPVEITVLINAIVFFPTGNDIVTHRVDRNFLACDASLAKQLRLEDAPGTSSDICLIQR